STAAVAVAPDGRQVATTSDDGEGWLTTWNTDTGQVRGSGVTGLGAVGDVEYSLDGKRIATAHAESKGVLWDAATRQQIRAFEFPKGTDVFRASFSADGKRLVTTTDGNVVYIWEVESGKEVLKFAAPSGWLVGRFLPDGRVVTGGQDGWVRVWDG